MRMRSWGFWQPLWRMWGETQARTITPLFYNTHTPHPVCQNMLAVGPVAAADWEIRAASWQLAAMLEASSSKRIYEGKRKKEEGKSSLYLFHLRTKTPTEQHKWCRDQVCKHTQSKVGFLIYTNQMCSFASEWQVTDCLSLPGELEKEGWLKKGTVRKTWFNRGGSRGEWV